MSTSNTKMHFDVGTRAVKNFKKCVNHESIEHCERGKIGRGPVGMGDEAHHSGGGGLGKPLGLFLEGGHVGGDCCHGRPE